MGSLLFYNVCGSGDTIETVFRKLSAFYLTTFAFLVRILAAVDRAF
jgi:hypothetical protein